MTSGGRNLITVSCVQFINNPLFLARSTMSEHGISISIPTINPCPLISFIMECFSFNVSSLSFRYPPSSPALFARSSSSITSSAAFAAVHARCAPPNVDAWSPALKVSMIPGFASIAPIGKPPPSAFATVKISGSTPKSCQANIAPVLQNPV